MHRHNAARKAQFEQERTTQHQPTPQAQPVTPKKEKIHVEPGERYMNRFKAAEKAHNVNKKVKNNKDQLRKNQGDLINNRSNGFS